MADLAEQSGCFDSVWVGDSLLAKPRLDALTLLAAIAGRTERLLLGPACLASFPLRNPLVFAYEWASLDQIAAGRTRLIVCAGGGSAGDWEAEARALGVPVRERQRRLEEHVTILRRLWSEDDVAHQGQFFQFEGITMEPKPIQQPCPIWLANNPWTVNPSPARIERALRRVARLADGWQTHSLSPDVFEAYWQTIQRYTVEAGRDPAELDNCLYHNIHLNPDREAAIAETKRFLDLYYSTSYTPERIERWSALGSAEACIENLRSYRGRGVQRITLRPCSWDQFGQLEKMIREVLPFVNS
jgi:alkanesulfonate monooxygenase SsuD/methylene tetrahydromethanopterin reductase-like flavin-dependent oxidoreductase (luciferase family)